MQRRFRFVLRRDHRMSASRWAAGLALLATGACQSPPPLAPDALDWAVREASATIECGEDIIIAGQRFAVGRPVVLWTDEGGYNAYQTSIRPGSEPAFVDATGRRYSPGRQTPSQSSRTLAGPVSSDLAELGRAVDQFVVHYDVCGISRTCFEVLHHGRGLSVHFLLDIDGSIYQTLDVRETAWHATRSNARSIGVELAHIGAYPPSERVAIERWYALDSEGPRITLPERLGDGGVRTPGFTGRPARPELIEGRINGSWLVQYDFTPEQYDSLAALAATLSGALPGIRLEVPRDPSGAIIQDTLSDEAWRSFAGLLGHHHIQTNKLDPGPAFDWERLAEALSGHFEPGTK
jgi:N-acetyl-anhydromuramyl-L-alanine amidase AmpD